MKKGSSSHAQAANSESLRAIPDRSLCGHMVAKPAMSAIGPKRTSLVAPHISAFGGKADMAYCGNTLSRSLLGVKRTCRFALHMSAFDPKRTSGLIGF